MSTEITLAIYCLMILLASLVGGWVPLIVHLNHRRMQISISLVAGFMLGIAVLHLLPHAVTPIGAYDAALWLMAGLLVMFFLERFFCFHHHDAPDATLAETSGQSPASRTTVHYDQSDLAHAESVENHAADVGPKDDRNHTGSGEKYSTHDHRLSWTGAAVGLTIHSVIAGVALGAAMKSDAHAAWPGLAVFFVIVLHKPFDALTIAALLAAGGYSRLMRHLVNALFSLAVPLGTVLFFGGLQIADVETSYAVGAALAFSAGTFLCISLSDLLPELQFHHHDRGKLSAALLVGIALAWGVAAVEHLSHGHHEHHHNHNELDRGHDDTPMMNPTPSVVDDRGHDRHDHNHDHDVPGTPGAHDH